MGDRIWGRSMTGNRWNDLVSDNPKNSQQQCVAMLLRELYNLVDNGSFEEAYIKIGEFLADETIDEQKFLLRKLTYESRDSDEVNSVVRKYSRENLD